MSGDSPICYFFDAYGLQSGPFTLGKSLEMLEELTRRRGASHRATRLEVWCLGWPRRLPAPLAHQRLLRDRHKFVSAHPVQAQV